MGKQNRPAERAMDPHRLARAYFDRFGKNGWKQQTLRYWRGDWWQWVEGRYTRVDRDEMKAHLTRELKAYADRVPLLDRYDNVYPITANVTNNVLQALSSMAFVPTHIEQPAWLGKTANPVQYLSMRNGLLDVGAASKCERDPAIEDPLRSHTPDWFSPVFVPYDFDPKATCPRWLQFLDEALEGDAERIAIIQEWFGYCLTADTRFHAFLIVEGDGANGKSVLLDTLANLLGPANVSRVPLEIFGERFQLMPTFGKLANIAPEVDNVKLAESTIKQFVGGDPIYVDRKGRDGIEFRPTARLVVATTTGRPFPIGRTASGAASSTCRSGSPCLPRSATAT